MQTVLSLAANACFSGKGSGNHRGTRHQCPIRLWRQAIHRSTSAVLPVAGGAPGGSAATVARPHGPRRHRKRAQVGSGSPTVWKPNQILLDEPL